MKKNILTLIILLCVCTKAGIVEDLLPGHWVEIPNSQLQNVAPNPIPVGSSGIASVMDAWCGGAYDTKRDRLIIWGGGHQDYSGNEIYVFDLNTLKWIRLNESSSNIGGDECSGIYPDGLPRARHTYNSVQYVYANDRYSAFGSGGFYPGGQCGNARFDAFNFTSLSWEKMPNMPNGSYGTGQFTAVDPLTGHVWSHGAAGSSILAEWIPTSKTWVDHGNQWTEEYLSYYLTAVIDSASRTLVGVGGGEVRVWDLNKTGVIAGAKINTYGATEIIAKNSPGLDYDPVSKLLVAWSGGPNVYTLDFKTKIWSKIVPANSNTVVPTTANTNGTFGRFRYIPSKNVFIAVNRVNENVYLYKLNRTPTTSVDPFLHDVHGNFGDNPSIVMGKRFITIDFSHYPYKPNSIAIAGLNGWVRQMYSHHSQNNHIYVFDKTSAPVGVLWLQWNIHNNIYSIPLTHIK